MWFGFGLVVFGWGLVVFGFFAINCIKGRKGTVLGPTSSGPYRPLSDVINEVCRHAGTDLASCYGRISTGILCSFLPSVG